MKHNYKRLFLHFEFSKNLPFVLIALLGWILVSCNQKKITEDVIDHSVVRDTTKTYERMGFLYHISEDTKEEHETYISKNGDTIPNQFKVYVNDTLDRANSLFYELEFDKTRNNNDSIVTGNLFVNIPKQDDSLKLLKKYIWFYYLQRENDSVVLKNMESFENDFDFEYKKLGNFDLVGVMTIYQEFETLRDSDSIWIREYSLAIDNKIFTDNPFVGSIED